MSWLKSFWTRYYIYLVLGLIISFLINQKAKANVPQNQHLTEEFKGDLFLIAAPFNFNPGLTNQPQPTPKPAREKIETEAPKKVISETKKEVNDYDKPLTTPTNPNPINKVTGIPGLQQDNNNFSPKENKQTASQARWVLQKLTPNFRLDQDNFGQRNQLSESTAIFALKNGDLVGITTGYNLFEQNEAKAVTNVPIYLSWQTEISKVKITLEGGVDTFNNQPTQSRLKITAESPLTSSATEDGKLKSLVVVSGSIENSAYKFNAKTLENEITFWRLTPSVYWQINPETSLFSLAQFGFFNDGNQEFQSFSRLERKFGQFSLAANLFTWSFQADLSSTSGYFSPSDFLVYSAEIAWEGKVLEFLNCRLSASWGKQRVNGQIDNAETYQALCTAELAPNVASEFGYTLSNIINGKTGVSGFSNETFTGTFKIEF